MCTSFLHQAIYASTLSAVPAFVQAVIVVAITLVFAMLFYNWLYKRTRRNESAYLRMSNSRLALILQSCGISVWVYDVEKRKYCKLTFDGEIESEYIPLDFSRFFDLDDFEQFKAAGVIPKEREEDVEKIKRMLKE